MRFFNFLNEANVVNTRTIESMIDEILNDEDVSNIHIIKWAKTTLRKEIINDTRMLIKLDKEVLDNILKNKKDLFFYVIRPDEFAQIKKDINNSRDVYMYHPNDDFSEEYECEGSQLLTRFYHAMEYFNEIQPTRQIRMSVDQAYQMANKYFEEKNKKATIFKEENIKKIKTYSDGSYWCNIIHQDEMKREGNIMHNCIGVVHTLKENEKSNYYSFRTNNNVPHISIFIDGTEIIECKLNSNKLPDGTKYKNELIDFLNILKIENHSHDLDKFVNFNKIVKYKNKWMSIDDVPLKPVEFTMGDDYSISVDNIKKLLEAYYNKRGTKILIISKNSKFMMQLVRNKQTYYGVGVKVFGDKLYLDELGFYFIIQKLPSDA